MSAIEPTVEVDERFGDAGTPAPEWSEVDAILDGSSLFWLSTVRRDGRPHVTPLPGVWLDGVLHFCTGEGEQKHRNLSADPRCALTTGTADQHVGTDVVVEGTAVRVTDRALLTRLSALWKSKLDWDFQAVEGGFADGDGNVAEVFGVRPDKVLVFAKSPYVQARYRFRR
jgi:general stress protein 26